MRTRKASRRAGTERYLTKGWGIFFIESQDRKILYQGLEHKVFSLRAGAEPVLMMTMIMMIMIIMLMMKGFLTTAQRLHYLGRLLVDEQGIRKPVGRQASWMGMLEADLVLQSVTMPASIVGLSAQEYESLKGGLKRIRELRREELLTLRALARKSYTNVNKSIQDKEVDDLTNWIDRILDPSRGYCEAQTWTRGTSKAPPLPTHLIEGEGEQEVRYGHPHELGAKYVRDWGHLYPEGI